MKELKMVTTRINNMLEFVLSQILMKKKIQSPTKYISTGTEFLYSSFFISRSLPHSSIYNNVSFLFSKMLERRVSFIQSLDP